MAIRPDATQRELIRQRQETILRLKRFWALANVLARRDKSGGVRGVTYAKARADELRRSGDTRTTAKCPSIQRTLRAEADTGGRKRTGAIGNRESGRVWSGNGRLRLRREKQSVQDHAKGRERCGVLRCEPGERGLQLTHWRVIESQRVTKTSLCETPWAHTACE